MSSLPRLRPRALPCLISRGHWGCWEQDHGKSLLTASHTINESSGFSCIHLSAPSRQTQEVSSEAHGMECGAGSPSLPPPLPSRSSGHQPALIKLTFRSPPIQGCQQPNPPDCLGCSRQQRINSLPCPASCAEQHSCVSAHPAGWGCSPVSTSSRGLGNLAGGWKGGGEVTVSRPHRTFPCLSPHFASA